MTYSRHSGLLSVVLGAAIAAIAPGAYSTENPSIAVVPLPELKTQATQDTPAVDKASAESGESLNGITLLGLDKVTARLSKLQAPLGTVMRFGNLEIIAHRCWQSPPEKERENAALLEIWEIKQGEQPTRIFSGWMFSSSPAVSSLSHPVYDVTVLTCSKVSAEEAE